MSTSSYNALAPYYNWIMSHVDYPKWARYIERQIKQYHPKATSVLELGAGTCPFSTQPISQHRQFIYSDPSLEMLDRNTSKRKLRQIQCSMLAIPFAKKFDVCLMIYDSINYLLKESEWVRGLRQVHKALKPGGLFLFDVTTEINSKDFFSNTVSVEEREDCHITRESWFDKKSKLQYNEFTIFIETPKGTYEKFRETHVQKVFKMSEIKKMIKTLPFRLIECRDEFSLHKAHAKSKRIHFILQAQ